MQFQMIVEKTENGFSDYSADYHVFTSRDSKNELLKNSVEALNLWFEFDGKVLDLDQIELIFN